VLSGDEKTADRPPHKAQGENQWLQGLVCPRFAHAVVGQSLESQSGRQDSNLRPSAPKALIGAGQALGFPVVAILLSGTGALCLDSLGLYCRQIAVAENDAPESDLADQRR
jgi:hypothetical protein